MQFMMLMIPAVYQGGKKVDPGFVPDPKKVEQMMRFNEELGQVFKILSLNGLHPVNTGRPRVVQQRENDGNRRPLHRNQRSARRLLVRSRRHRKRKWCSGRSVARPRRAT